MWMLRLKTGLEITEKELKYWDNVPQDVEITTLGLYLHRHGELPPFTIEVTGYEEICCAKVGEAIGGGASNIVGYAVYCVKENLVTEFQISKDGMSLKIYPREELKLRLSCLRKMVA